MAPTRRRFLGTVTTAGALGLAGCSSDGDGGEGTTTTEGADPTATETATESGDGSMDGDGSTGDGDEGATVAVAAHDELGDVLVDGEGRTLYMFDSDTRGEEASACYDDCAGAWPPLTTEGDPSAGDGVTASLGTFEREDGSSQVTANGWPLYYFANDAEPGDANGQGVGDVWWVLAPDGTPVRSTQASVEVATHDELGDVLVDGDGRMLYMFDSDTRGGGASTCYDDCADAWPPLTTEGDPEAGEGVTANLATFEREGGARQVTANGWPLYYFANDAEPGQANGQGVGDVWWVLGPDGVPKRPTQASVGVVSHDEYGDVLADADGRILYMFDQDEQGASSSTCSEGCADAWPPLVSEAEPESGDGVTAPLSTFERGDGTPQVAADGWPLYYYAQDEEPGDATGQGVGDVWWVIAPDGSPRRDTEDESAGGDGGMDTGSGY